ncbi:MAG: hypothetical protein V2A56_03540 [bacterium]
MNIRFLGSRWLRWAVLTILLTTFLAGCAAFRSDLQGTYSAKGQSTPTRGTVSVFFIFDHVRQTLGLDAIPKLQNKRTMMWGFDDIFQDALREVHNLGPYATFTEESDDVNRPDRRAVRDSLWTKMDYTVKIRIESTQRFSSLFLGSLASSVTLTVLPIPYRTTYTMTTSIFDRNHQLLTEYHRQAHLTRWVETLLVFVYPFAPTARVREEIYMEMLHDTFRQIDQEGVLKPAVTGQEQD